MLHWHFRNSPESKFRWSKTHWRTQKQEHKGMEEGKCCHSNVFLTLGAVISAVFLKHCKMKVFWRMKVGFESSTLFWTSVEKFISCEFKLFPFNPSPAAFAVYPHWHRSSVRLWQSLDWRSCHGGSLHLLPHHLRSRRDRLGNGDACRYGRICTINPALWTG